jgi:hypothetical protein
MSEKPPPPPRTKSGESIAVSTYRKKLDSIVDGQAEDLDALNRRLEAYIHESSTPPPVVEEEPA